MHALEPRAEFDQFIVGVARWKPHFPESIVYNEDAIINHLIQKAQEADPSLSAEDAWTEAVDHFEYNIIGGSGFYGVPVFVSRAHWESVLEQDATENAENSENTENAENADPTKAGSTPQAHEEE